VPSEQAQPAATISSSTTTKSNSPPPTNSLATWLSLKPIPPPAALPTPFLTSSPVFDKDSVFIAYAMPLPPSIINHKSSSYTHEQPKKVVEALIKCLPHDHERLPDVIAGRGVIATTGKQRKKIKPNHNMWAYRVSACGGHFHR
jgi:hypothetical protein